MRLHHRPLYALTCVKHTKLLKFGTEFSSKDDEDVPLSLSQAIRANDVAAVTQALQRGVNPSEFEEGGTTTPLVEAAVRGYVDIMEVLLLHGASPFLSDILYNTALHWAVANCHMDCVVLLLDYGITMGRVNGSLRNPLMLAAYYGHEKIAQCLIDRGAEVGWPVSEHYESALTIASEKGHVEIAKILLKAGHNDQDRSKELHIALIKAASTGHLEVIKLLLDEGAEVNGCQYDSEIPIFAAINGGDLSILKLLIAYHVDVEERNKEGYTPLMLAAQKGAAAMVTELIDVGKLK
ncbi:unnamed protein product [Hydatigera taeniaeformis]|uniref:ANK_REP_REGION domain-containing protein n=1 Tax=Hydatigena taeniaeformis TaxID=6205 RepID=A0A0R3WTQ9_HYDTA|nr:unnamed protein product [Hydatigera taeniaeformis]